jgi:hypothetical protein
LDIIADSAFELARRNHGAIIVIPGEEDIRELAQGGLDWNGDISREMLLSVFFPDNPVHDGAAIVEGDRVSRVGAILPLSRREDLPSHFGTRHRAALGLSEISDAVVVVVSEERGEVSLAKGTRLRGIGSRRKLAQKLEEHFGIADEQGPYQKRERIEISIAALVSLLFIAGFWFSISQGLETLITFDVPIEYQNRDPNREIVQTSVNTVRLTLSGSGTLIKSMRPDQVRVRLDLTNTLIGQNHFSITSQNITLPPGIVLKGVTPHNVSVDLDVTVRKELPVQVDWTGRLPENLTLTEASVEPQRVEIVGSRRVLETLSTVYTEKVFLDRLRENAGVLEAGLVLQPGFKVAPGSSDRLLIKYITRRRE